MKKFFKRLLIILLIALVIIQFFRPEKNKSAGPYPNDITTKYDVPANVLAILNTSCYDCHSNNTDYPWYAEVQPVAWWLNNHIQEGKHELNFSEFTTYRIRKQFVRLEQTAELVRENAMPLPSYTWLHKDAILSAEHKKVIEDWTARMLDTIRAKYPPDSLIKK